MGYARWSNHTYSNLRARYAHQSRDDIFQNNRLGNISDQMNPYGLRLRESRDSQAHPNSIAIGVFLDVTGSMGRIPEQLIRYKLGTLMDTLLKHGVEDPQVMFSAIGDQYTDRAPLQVGQFESGALEMNQCLSQVYLEGGGGGQAKESYALAWLIAGHHTSIDCFEKRAQKGFLFTIGDEMNHDNLEPDFLSRLMGYPEARFTTAADLLAAAQEKYHVYHIHINETGYRNNPQVIGYWKNLLGENFLILDDHTALAEMIASVIAVMSGVELGMFTNSFDAGTASMIQGSLKGIAQKAKTLQQRAFNLF